MLVREQNAIKKEWNEEKIKIGLIYPQTYRVAMTSLAIQLLYFLFNSWDNFICERIFKPLNPTQTPYSLESQKNMKDFDIIAISCQFEFDYIYAIEILQKAGIEPDVRKRKESDPLIMIGGPSVTVNPFPILFVPDIFFLGDFEPVERLFRNALSEKSKRLRIESLLDIPGVIGYNHSYDKNGKWIGQKARSVKIKDFSNTFYPIKQIIPENVQGTKNEPIFGKAYYLETDRGCNQRCNFCMVGHCRFPRVGRTLEKLTEIIDLASEQNDFDKVIIYGSAVAQSGNLDKLLEHIVNLGYEVSCSSFRADYITEELLTILKNGGQRTLTLAPETGDEELRLDINKIMYDEDIFNAVDIAWKTGFRQLKLYMIYGFPFEDEIVEQRNIDFVKNIRKKYFPTGKISVSINQFISKANTPFQFAPMLTIKDSKMKQQKYKKEIYQIKNTTPGFYEPEWAAIQKILSLRDQTYFPFLLEIAQLKNTIGNWKRLLKKNNNSFDKELLWHPEIKDELPWDNIIHNLSKKTVVAAYLKYMDKRAK